MGQLKDTSKSSRCDYSAVCKAADDLADQACVLSARYLKDGTLRLQFNREVFCYGRGIVNEVAQGKKSPEQGLKDINNEQNHLQSRSLEVAQKGVAAIAGVLQFAAGAGMCYGSAGLLCLFGGAPLMAHGANNAYENGRSLWGGRSDIQGPLRKGYQGAAKIMGGGEFAGDMAYGAVDLGLSAYGVGRLVLRPDAWRLFRYVRADFVRGYEHSSKAALTFEVISNATTINTLSVEASSRDQ